MADASDTMKHLVSEFDTAPAGTREEAQLAKVLSEAIHMHGLETINQDFTFNVWSKPVGGVALLLTALFGFIAGISSGGVLTIVMFILALITCAVFLFESNGRQVVSGMLGKGYSQNLIARHPAAGTSRPTQDGLPQAKPRPVVIVAHYDTPRADIMASKTLRKYAPYLGQAVKISLIALFVTVFLQILPFPQGFKNFCWALDIVAALIIAFDAVRILLNSLFLSYTNGANDNMSGVTALLTIINRVRPSKGSDFASISSQKQEDEADKTTVHNAGLTGSNSAVTSRRIRRNETALNEESDKDTNEGSEVRRSASRTNQGVRSNGFTGSQPRVSRRTVPAKKAPVRRGVKVLKSLGMVPASCEIVYETNNTAFIAGEKANAVATTASSKTATAGEETMLTNPVASTQSSPSVAKVDDPSHEAVVVTKADGTKQTPVVVSATANAPVVSTPSQVSSQASSAGSGETSVLTRDQLEKAMREEESDRERLSAATTDIPARTTTRSVDTDAAAQALVPEPQPVETQPKTFNVLVSSDEPDAELRQAPAELPRDVAEQQGVAMSDDARRDSILNNPNWGTTSFTPVTQTRRAIEDLPDPAVAAVDPFSVSSIETIGDYDPDDFSSINFETGTHQSVTPAMLEEYKRDHMDGFDDFTGAGSDRKNKKNKRGKRTERIGQRAAEMQQQMQEQSFSDWLGVDEDYDARKNGEQIGSWDNFSDDGQTRTAQASSQTSSADSPDSSQWNGDTNIKADKKDDGHRWQGGAARSRQGSDPYDNAEAVEPDDADQSQIDDVELRRAAMTLGDADLVSHEIWFVFTGASEEHNAGIKAFLTEYDNKLHNAIFINLECVGNGRQTLVLEEGKRDHRKADRRTVNLLGTISHDFGRPLAMIRMPWRDTEITPALRRGRHGVTICGVTDNVPANAYSTADVPESISVSKINDIVDIVTEFIRRS